MSLHTPIPIAAAPPVPSSLMPEATFDSMYEAFNAYEREQLVPGINREITGVHTNAAAAADAATQAAGARNEAADFAQDAAEYAQAAGEASGATAWSADALYDVGDRVFMAGASGGLTYRRQVPGTTPTPPDQDAANWQVVVSPATRPVLLSTHADNGTPLAAGTDYKLRAQAAYSRPLPVAPADGAEIVLINSHNEWGGSLFTLTRPSGHTINGLADDLIFNTNNARLVRARFTAPGNWVITAG